MIFYFTATGNSLYAAKQLDETRVSIPQAMRTGVMEYTADVIGIVSPVYGHEVPPMVRDFLHRAVFHTDYFYMVLTYGNRHGGAAALARQLCDECGLDVKYINILWMADNWLPSFDMNEQKAIDKKVDLQLSVLRADIAGRKSFIAPVTDADRAAHHQFLERMSSMPADAWQHLIQITDRCVGCGICEKVCPSGSIRIEGGRAVQHPGQCQTCLACVHACPQKAIALSVPEKNPDARYRCEHISLSEIIAANHQA